jgi:hypothetical protein
MVLAVGGSHELGEEGSDAATPSNAVPTVANTESFA